VPEAVASVAWDEDVSTACAPFEAARLTCAVEWKTAADTPAGTLVEQAPRAHKRVNIDTPVVLTYSSGPESSAMPKLAGLTLDEAKQKLYKIGVTISTLEDVTAPAEALDRVVSTSVEEGAEVRNGGEVKLFIGSAAVTAPNWGGLTRERVTEEASSLKLEVTFQEEESDKPVGTVLSQTPKAGAPVPSAGLTVVVAKPIAVAKVAVPDIIGKGTQEAQTLVAEAGFRSIKTVVIKNAEVTSEQVTQVVPGVGEEAPTDQPVVIIVSQPIE
jgi:beta-lactam-binding protein with PASTA domain